MVWLPGILLPLVVLSTAGSQGSTDEAVVYAALPLRNLTASTDAAAEITAQLRFALETRGAQFVPPADLEQLLRSKRIRYTDSVSRADARSIGAETGAQYLIAGSLLDYVGGPDPHISLALRVVDAVSGTRLQSVFLSLSGDDFEGLLGLGAINDVGELRREVLARVLEHFEADGSPSLAVPEAVGRRPSDALSHFVRKDFDVARMQRVAVLPLINRTNRVGAGAVFAETLAHHWFVAGVDIVEPSELRSAFVRQGIRSLDFIDDQVYARLGEEIGTHFFVLGSIDVYAEVFVFDESFPLIEASIRVLDAEQRRLVAAVSLRRRGDDYHVLLGLGNVYDPTTLTDRAAGEMIALILR